MPYIKVEKNYVSDYSVDTSSGQPYVTDASLSPSLNDAVYVPASMLSRVLAVARKCLNDSNLPDNETLVYIGSFQNSKAMRVSDRYIDVDYDKLRVFFEKRNISFKSIGIDMGMGERSAHNCIKYFNGTNRFPRAKFTKLAKKYPGIYYYVIKSGDKV